MTNERVRLRFVPRCVRSLASFAALALASACAAQPVEPAASGAAPAASEPAAVDPAAHGIDDRRGKAGASLFVAHQVSDFDGFKKFFDEGAPERANAGLKGHVLTRIDDGRVVIHLFGADLPALKMTLDSPTVQDYLSRSGAPDASLVWLSHDELIKLPARAPTGPTFSLYVRLRAADLAALRRGFVELQPLFRQQGVIGSGLHQSVTQADLLFLHFVGSSRGGLDALWKRTEFQDWLRNSGMAGAPDSFLGEDVSRSRTQ